MPDDSALLSGRPIRRIGFFVHPTLGDTIHLTAVAGWIKERYPQAKLVIFTSRQSAPVWELCPAADEIVNREGDKIRLFGRILASRLDLAILAYGQNTVSLLTKLAGIPFRVGIEGTKHNRYLQRAVPLQREIGLVEGTMRDLLAPLGFDCVGNQLLLDADRLPQFSLPKPRDKGWIGIQMGASNPLKQWPIERFASVAKSLQGDGWDIVWFGGPSDRSTILAAIGGAEQHVLAGETTVLESISAMRGCSLVISNDTGPMHFAGVVGTTVVGLFGPTEPAWLMPPGSGHVLIQGVCSCLRKSLEDCQDRCMAAISVGQVLAAAREILARDHPCETQVTESLPEEPESDPKSAEVPQGC